MHVAIVGSRKFPDLDSVRKWVRKHLLPGHVLVSGGAKGVDRVAEKAARDQGNKTMIFKPDVKKFGVPGALFRRNTSVVENADLLVAFWDGISTGTQDTVKKAIKRKVPTNIYIRYA